MSSPSGVDWTRWPERAPAGWPILVDRPYDIDAVARTRSRVIDGALTLLGLARIEPELDRAFRVAGVRRQLENHLGFGHRVPVRTE